MAHYEVRKYPGWHHHMLTTMLAHFFLWHLKLHLGKKSPSPHRVTAAGDLWGRLDDRRSWLRLSDLLARPAFECEIYDRYHSDQPQAGYYHHGA